MNNTNPHQKTLDTLIPLVRTKKEIVDNVRSYILGISALCGAAGSLLALNNHVNAQHHSPLTDIAVIFPHQRGLIPATDTAISISRHYNVHPELVERITDIIATDWPTDEHMRDTHYKQLSEQTGITIPMLHEHRELLVYAVAQRLAYARERLPANICSEPALVATYWAETDDLIERAIRFTTNAPDEGTYGPLANFERNARVQQFIKSASRLENTIREHGHHYNPAEQNILDTLASLETEYMQTSKFAVKSSRTAYTLKNRFLVQVVLVPNKEAYNGRIFPESYRPLFYKSLGLSKNVLTALASQNTSQDM